MEGPSLYLAAEQLAPFKNKKILKVEGNTKIGKERLFGKKVLAIFSWGKHLVFQFDDFALRVHFMLFGSFSATVKEKKVTGDYPTKNRLVRLSLSFGNGLIEMYSCSLKFIESDHARADYDFSVDTMSSEWDEKKALRTMQDYPDEEISDLLLDQNHFAGVGNIIRNEVLFLEKILPTTPVKEISLAKRKKLLKTLREYLFNFYTWRKAFVLRKHFQIYRKHTCPHCHSKVSKHKTGKRERMSYYCSTCQS